MRSWLVSTLGVAALLVTSSLAAGPIRPPRRPLHGELQNIQLRNGNRQFITDWVNDAYLECLAQDFFQVSQRAHRSSDMTY